MRRFGLMAILTLGLAVTGCTNKTDTTDDAGDNTPGEPETDPYTVTALAITDDSLEIEVSYSGGCKEHTFTISWNEIFAESHPVQAWLSIHHDAMGDTCKALITETLSFDLTPMREAYQTGYQGQPGMIVIHVGDQSIDYEF